MRKKWIVLLFLIGLGILSYPTIANIISMKSHKAIIEEYKMAVSELTKKDIISMKQKLSEHNRDLKENPMDFIDPYDNGTVSNGNKNYYETLDTNSTLGALEIPSIGVNLPIYYGTSDEVLSKGVGHLENSSIPTGELGTHSVLTAHRGLPSSKLFRNINDLKIGDEFHIRILDELMTYKVYNIEIVLPDETEWLEYEDDHSIVTLLSCEPYILNTHRLLVHGKLIDTTKELDEQLAGIQLGEQHLIDFILFITAVICIVIVVILLVRNRRATDRPDN